MEARALELIRKIGGMEKASRTVPNADDRHFERSAFRAPRCTSLRDARESVSPNDRLVLLTSLSYEELSTIADQFGHPQLRHNSRSRNKLPSGIQCPVRRNRCGQIDPRRRRQPHPRGARIK